MKRRDALRAFAMGAIGTASGTWQSPVLAKPSVLSFIMAIGPGSGADTSVRILGDIIAREAKRTVIIENKPGADGIIATQHVLNGPADGSRVLFTSPSLLILPLVNKTTSLDPATQLTPVNIHTRGGTALVTKKGRFKNLAELITEAKKNPGKVSLATYGGHYYKLLSLMIQRELGIELNVVSYKTPAPAANDVVGGTVDAILMDAGGARDFFIAGKTQILAITHERRLPIYEDVPTFKELGFPRLESYIWTGFSVKAGTPSDVVDELYQSISSAIKSKEYRDYLLASNAGTEIVNFSPQIARQYQEEESKRFATLIAQTGYTA